MKYLIFSLIIIGSISLHGQPPDLLENIKRANSIYNYQVQRIELLEKILFQTELQASTLEMAYESCRLEVKEADRAINLMLEKNRSQQNIIRQKNIQIKLLGGVAVSASVYSVYLLIKK